MHENNNTKVKQMYKRIKKENEIGYNDINTRALW